ncbi:MAG: RNA polymerase sigma factor [Verrucomicrobia bacterium]|nr:RNA polymerase sigma factor [Verrucomicrobiota bacterium]
MKTLLNSAGPDDRLLVKRHLAGDGEAFRQIVERYQGAVCAVAYSACGDLARSEDVAQEAFVAAWKQLPQLREPEKLRAWLCGITRNLAHAALRRAGRIPTARAGEISPDLPAEGAGPQELAVGADEAALMWGALAGLPDTYREPMVLFYREGRSVAAVAAALELSEDTARQRLARGRAMLTDRMARIVEETLERSAPAPTFAGLVLLAVPGAISPVVAEALGGSAATKTLAAAGAIGGAAAKGGAILKVLSAVAFLPALLQGAEDYLRFEARNAAQAEARTRRRAAWNFLTMQAGIGVFVTGIVVVPQFLPSHPSPLVYGPLGLVVLAAMWTAVRAQCRMNRLTADLPKVVVSTGFERRSAGRFLGLPLYHARLGTRPGWGVPAVKAWIAISDGTAVGGLFAFGRVALAPFSMGLFGVGLLSVGIFALGFGAMGGAAAGWWSHGVAVAGGEAAKGVLAWAPHYVDGARSFMSHAVHAGDAIAKAYFQEHAFYRFTAITAKGLFWAAMFGWVMPSVLISWQLWRTRNQTMVGGGQ